jgi:hypothetical protein
MTKSFFEYLGLADVERIHSQFLAWVLSGDCNAIDQQERDRLFKNLFKIGGEVTDIQTERNRIDILIATSSDVIIVENKIKSSQHSNQLDRYRKFCDTTFPKHQRHYFFLTLIDEKTKDKDWQQLTYSIILKHLSNLKLNPNNSHSSIISEYLIFLERLDRVVSDFKAQVKNYDMVFLDGKKKKQDKKRSDYRTENEWFIAANQLETILQKSFLNTLVEQVKNPRGIINDTRGDALVDFPLQGDIEFEGRKYSTALQLQLKTIKFTFAIQSQPYLQSDKVWIENVIPLMSHLSEQNNYSYKKLNKPTDLAYISISKKLDEYYWHKPIEDLAEFIQTEISNCKEMSRELKQLLVT